MVCTTDDLLPETVILLLTEVDTTLAMQLSELNREFESSKLEHQGMGKFLGEVHHTLI